MLQVIKEELNICAVFPRELEQRTEPVQVHHKKEGEEHVVADSYDPRVKAFGRRLLLPVDISGMLLLVHALIDYV